MKSISREVGLTRVSIGYEQIRVTRNVKGIILLRNTRLVTASVKKHRLKR